MGGNLAESDVQVVLVGYAVFEHLVEQPKDSMTSNRAYPVNADTHYM